MRSIGRDGAASNFPSGPGRGPAPTLEFDFPEVLVVDALAHALDHGQAPPKWNPGQSPGPRRTVQSEDAVEGEIQTEGTSFSSS